MVELLLGEATLAGAGAPKAGVPLEGGGLGDEATHAAESAPEDGGARQQPLPTPCPSPWDGSCHQKRRFFKRLVKDSAANVYIRR
jgi:hypothetical protein